MNEPSNIDELERFIRETKVDIHDIKQMAIRRCKELRKRLKELTPKPDLCPTCGNNKHIFSVVLDRPFERNETIVRCEELIQFANLKEKDLK